MPCPGEEAGDEQAEEEPADVGEEGDAVGGGVEQPVVRLDELVQEPQPEVDPGRDPEREDGKTQALVGTVPSYPQYLEAADATLTAAATDALAASASVPEGIRALAEDGNLTLTGTVRYGSQRAAARSAVGGLTGVRNVHDKIELAFSVEQADVKERVKKGADAASEAGDVGWGAHRRPP